MYKNLTLSGVNLQLFVRIFNLLDGRNPINVYGDTGRPDFTLQEEQVSDYDRGWFDIPTYYSEPRSFYAGVRISL